MGDKIRTAVKMKSGIKNPDSQWTIKTFGNFGIDKVTKLLFLLYLKRDLQALHNCISSKTRLTKCQM